MKTRAHPLFASERLRHAAIAMVVVLVLASMRFLSPVDFTIWAFQTRLFERASVVDVAYVDLSPQGDTQAEAAASLNRQVLASIRAFKRADAELIAINVPLRRSDSPSLDRDLRAELIGNRDRVLLTQGNHRPEDQDADGKRSDPYFEAGMQVVDNHLPKDFLDLVWSVEPFSKEDGERVPSLWTRLTRVGGPLGTEIGPDYSILIESVPRFDAAQLMSQGAAEARLPGGGKVVIGSPYETRISNQGILPSGLIHILAATTYDQGRGLIVYWNVLLIGIFAALLACVVSRLSSSSRRQAYGILVTAIVIGIFLAGAFGVRAEFSYSIALLAIYGGFRALARYKRRHLLLEPRSRLPNFVALHRDLGGDEIAPNLAIVVAKVARLDSVFTTLSPSEQERYLRQIADRLAIGQNGSTIYYDGGKYFAFALKTAQFEDLEAHLRGLRAIATQSVEVGARLFDVSMTLGVDQDAYRTVSNRLSSAIAAADRAREAYRPVFMITDFQSDKEDWDYSLQTRLEHALSHDRIDIALQPQFDLASGDIVGAEALARWFDEEQGQIPPERFIGQCERVGRLDELTERVLSKTLDSIEAMSANEWAPDVSLNISAIQFADEGIADLIERQIVGRAIDPKGVTIELTETARIENFVLARRTIERIKQLGMKFSIDDFGIQTANLETIYELPFDEIKIDRLFIGNLRQSTKARAITSSLIGLARDSGMVCVAEGIEDNATLELLKELGCERAQGYFLSRPIPPKDLINLLKSRTDGLDGRRYHG
ncbi:hypothetical protein GCM10022600_12600 [Qipengyuania pelagi]